LHLHFHGKACSIQNPLSLDNSIRLRLTACSTVAPVAFVHQVPLFFRQVFFFVLPAKEIPCLAWLNKFLIFVISEISKKAFPRGQASSVSLFLFLFPPSFICKAAVG
jgi:hypothetical protein